MLLPVKVLLQGLHVIVHRATSFGSHNTYHNSAKKAITFSATYDIVWHHTTLPIVSGTVQEMRKHLNKLFPCDEPVFCSHNVLKRHRTREIYG